MEGCCQHAILARRFLLNAPRGMHMASRFHRLHLQHFQPAYAIHALCVHVIKVCSCANRAHSVGPPWCAILVLAGS